MEEQQEKRNRNIGLITSALVHGLLLLLFLFFVAWRAPDPPLPEFGIELNFGVDQEGTGDVQPDTPPATDAQEDIQTASEEAVPEQKEEPQEIKEEVIASEQLSDATLKEEKETEKTKETEKPKTEYKKPDKQEKESESKDANQPVSHGDDSKKQGDKGNPEGPLDAAALYGKQGGGAGGDGMVLSMAGWAWADHPKIPNLPDNEDGRVEFEIECDEDGEIVGITTIQRGLSAKAEQLLKEEIRKNSLVRTSNGQTPTRSKGRVVFVLKTK